MYAVIFKAKIKDKTEHYHTLSNKLHQLAVDHYNCIKLENYHCNAHEISISYWHSLEDIKAWKNEQQHLAAQQQALESWYTDYSVEVVEIVKHYKR